MSEVDSSCASCLLAYTGRDRVPKILSCYHTYCRYSAVHVIPINNAVIAVIVVLVP